MRNTLALATLLGIASAAVVGSTAVPTAAAQPAPVIQPATIDLNLNLPRLFFSGYEDDPQYDCRVHGNQTCGVVISGTRYLLYFGR